jgi:hypothetical protein
MYDFNLGKLAILYIKKTKMIKTYFFLLLVIISIQIDRNSDDLVFEFANNTNSIELSAMNDNNFKK